jgi:ABC-type protease/lipase transport system fused ATPase/permease subunit
MPQLHGKFAILRQILQPIKPIFLSLMLFSMVLNVLMLAPSIYMLQVYDRVLSSQSQFTLFAITLIVLFVYLAIGLLEWVRSNLLLRLSAAMDLAQSDRVHAAAFAQTPLARSMSPAQVVQDFSAVRQVVTGSFVLALLDLPWIPLYVGLLFAFEWPLGLLAIIRDAVINFIAVLTEKLTKEPLEKSNKIASQAAFMLNKQHRHIEIISALGMIPMLGKRWQAQNREALLLQIQASDYMAQTKCRRAIYSLNLAIVSVRGRCVFGITRTNVGRNDDCRLNFIGACFSPCRATHWLMATT